ncbi:MAG: hypothetical protein FWG64_13470 [Firmicutes bacterium]|nr:hypothetical protein [Bacillota bacterium]
MSEEGYVNSLKYIIGEEIQYYRIAKQKSYTGIMHRINMGCEIYPRENNFWDIEALKTITVIEKYIHEMALYSTLESRNMATYVKKTLEDIDYTCDAYRWYENKLANQNQEQKEESAWNAEDYAIGVEYVN